MPNKPFETQEGIKFADGTVQTTATASGETGPAGIISQATAPTDTDILWLDTSVNAVEGIGPTGPTGGAGPTGPQGDLGPTGPAGTTNYNDLLNKPVIPTNTNQLTNGSGFITLSDVPAGFSGDYNDLTNKPTAVSTFTNDADYATVTYVDNAVSNLVASAPATLDTLNEIAEALGNDPNLATTLSNQIGLKANSADVYTQTQVDTALALKADTTSLAAVATSGSYNDLTDKPTLFSGSYTDLTDKPSIPTDTSDLTNGAGFITSSALTGYATETYVNSQDFQTSGQVDTSITSRLAQTDYQTSVDVANTLAGYYTKGEADTLLLAKADTASLAAVATSGSYDDLTNKPTLFDGAYSNLTGAPTLATVATSGSYTDLSNTPTLFDGNYSSLTGAPILATVATSGLYSDLSGTPSIPSVLTDLGIIDGTNGQVLTTDGAGGFLFATVNSGGGIALTDLSVSISLASGGGDLSYNNTTGVFTFTPAAQTQVDWNETNVASPAFILNKPTVPTALSELTNDTGFITGYTETEPAFTASAAFGITSTDVQNWNNSYTWGDHAAAGYQLASSAFDGNYNNLTNTPTIPTDVADLTDNTNLLSGGGIALTDLSVTTSTTPVAGGSLSYDSITGTFTFAPADYPTLATVATSGDYLDLINTPMLSLVATSGSYNDLDNKPTIVTSYLNLTDTPTLATVATSGDYLDLINTPAETDPLFMASVAASIGAGDIQNWNDAYGWGDHASAGYSTFDGSYTSLTNTPTSITDFGITDGSNGQVLTTNGAGVFTFSSPSVDANDLTGTTLASGVTASNLTSTGTLTSLTVSGTATLNGTSSNVVRRAFGLVAADTYVELDDIKAKVTSNSQLSLMLVSGSWSGTGWTQTMNGSLQLQHWVNLPLSTGFDTASQQMTNQGHGCVCVISDQTPNAKAYQITVIRSGTTGNMWNISIERLV